MECVQWCCRHENIFRLAGKSVVYITTFLLFPFLGIVVHQESVCATFGSGLGSACVVDVGDQKTSVCCVEDGVSHRNTR